MHTRHAMESFQKMRGNTCTNAVSVTVVRRVCGAVRWDRSVSAGRLLCRNGFVGVVVVFLFFFCLGRFSRGRGRSCESYERNTAGRSFGHTQQGRSEVVVTCSTLPLFIRGRDRGGTAARLGFGLLVFLCNVEVAAVKGAVACMSAGASSINAGCRAAVWGVRRAVRGGDGVGR